MKLVNIAAGLALIASTIAAVAQAPPEILIFGGQDHKKFLGCLSCNETSADSVWNDFSKYGFKNGFATWSQFGPYKSQFSRYSACNEFASDPPVLIDKLGRFHGRLSINKFAAGSVCGATGNEQVCNAVRVMCATD